MALSCPVCEKVLQPLYISGVELDYCKEGCKGIWFDAGELCRVKTGSKEEIQNAIDEEFVSEPFESSQSKTQRLCPACKCAMAGYNYALNLIFI